MHEDYDKFEKEIHNTQDWYEFHNPYQDDVAMNPDYANPEEQPTPHTFGEPSGPLAEESPAKVTRQGTWRGQVTQAAKKDAMDIPLVKGRYEGTGAILRGDQIYINVSPPRNFLGT